MNDPVLLQSAHTYLSVEHNDMSSLNDIIVDGAKLSSRDEAVALVTADGQVAMMNARFSQEGGFLDKEGHVVEAFRSRLDELLAGRSRVRCALEGVAGEMIYDLMALPCRRKEDNGWLVIASDITVDVSLRNALIESRARYMDLVSLAADYAWETDAQGKFTTITPTGFAGLPIDQLIGSDPDALCDPSMMLPAVSPFRAPVAMRTVEFWVRTTKGASVCFEVSAVPLYDEKDHWCGARGVCQDVTEDRRDQRFLAESRTRERLLARITGLFRTGETPDDMLRLGAAACAQGMAAAGCQIFSMYLPLGLSVPRMLLVSSYGQVPPADRLDLVLEELYDDSQEMLRSIIWDEGNLLIAPIIYSGHTIGALSLWRLPGESEWLDQDLRLLDAVCGQVAVLIEQRTHYHQLLDASRTDPLTALLNRRAFDEEVGRRFRRLHYNAQPAALVYADLDNFKAVNDIHGHKRGDEVLAFLADILRSNTRPTDLVARLGGDEFAVWLENTNEAVAIARVRLFLTAAQALKSYSGSPQLPLTLSAGIAVFDPSSKETLESFIHRADMAMYEVKRKGKGTFAVAPGRIP